MGLKSLARATLLQALRDLGRPAHSAECLAWFRAGTPLGESELTVEGILGVSHVRLVALALQLARQPGVRRGRGETWLRKYLQRSEEYEQDRQEISEPVCSGGAAEEGWPS